MNQAERDLVLTWKQAIHGRFALERHLRGGSIFISLDNNEVYLVKGITSSWQEMFDGQPMPVILTTTLLPFKGTIITDGLINAGNIAVGPGIRRDLKDTYMRAKDLGRIVKSLV